MNVKPGDIVRVKDDAVRHFLIAFAAKVKDRTATVESVFVPLGATRPTVRVRFHKRGNRGKEFTEFMRLEDVEQVTGI